MSDLGITVNDVISDLQYTRTTGHIYYAAITLLVYDTLDILPREVKHIHRRPGWSPIRIIYIMLRIWAFQYLMFAIYVNQSTSVSKRLCGAYYWVTGFSIDILFPVMMKTVLALRLRALWDYNLKVTILLFLATAIEILVAASGTFGLAVLQRKYYIDAFPLHGCFALFTADWQSNFNSVMGSASWTCRFASTGIEVLLTAIKLYQSLRQAGLVWSSFRDRIKHIKQLTPIIYIFYRDGTLFFVPIFVVSMFGLVGSSLLGDSDFSGFAAIDWTPWLAIVYYFCGTRLILNVREAGCKLTESMVSREISSLQFNNGPHRDNDQSGNQ